MSTPLEWAVISRYCAQAGGYSVCKIGSAKGWTFEVWRGGEQLKVGLRTETEARRLAQRLYDRQRAQEQRDADTQPT